MSLQNQLVPEVNTATLHLTRNQKCVSHCIKNEKVFMINPLVCLFNYFITTHRLLI